MNLGAGRFADVSAAAGIGGPLGAALGVIAADFDADGRVDFYVANDATDNLLWINQGDGRFVDHALLAGVAVNGDGDAEASMGVVAEDFDADCDVDLFVTHLTAETNTLYANDGGGAFVDVSNRRGIAAASTPFTGLRHGMVRRRQRTAIWICSRPTARSRKSPRSRPPASSIPSRSAISCG